MKAPLSAASPVKQGWRRPYRAVCRQRHIPLLGYFRHRVDLKLVAGLAVFSTMTFLVMTAATIWEMPMLANKTVAGSLFVTYVLLLLWILISVAASYRLRKIGTICEGLEKEVDGRLEKVLQARIKKLEIPRDPPIPGTGGPKN